jgi:hypothetical protein
MYFAGLPEIVLKSIINQFTAFSGQDFASTDITHEPPAAIIWYGQHIYHPKLPGKLSGFPLMIFIIAATDHLMIP